jgi:hypothetical protein
MESAALWGDTGQVDMHVSARILACHSGIRYKASGMGLVCTFKDQPSLPA